MTSNRIISSAQHIDNSLIATKGRPFVERMRESLPRLPDAGAKVEGKGITVETAETVMRICTYHNIVRAMLTFRPDEEWALKARFQYCDMSIPPAESDDGKVRFKHAYDSQLQSISNMVSISLRQSYALIPIGRTQTVPSHCEGAGDTHDEPSCSMALDHLPEASLAVVNMLRILTSFRVDETRVDCLKAMIIGPDGTPYENGCFLFDICLPIDYNYKCPLVKSMTTNGGRYR